MSEHKNKEAVGSGIRNMLDSTDRDKGLANQDVVPQNFMFVPLAQTCPFEAQIIIFLLQ